MLSFNQNRVKNLVDKTYNSYFNIFKQQYYHTDIRLSDIVVNKEEQREIIKITLEWGMKFDDNIRTDFYVLFPMLYELRIPKYLGKIGYIVRNMNRPQLMPFLSVANLFTEQFLKEHDSDFSVKFYDIINLETFNRIMKIIKDNI